ncbi:MAG TPA: hypothetical protein ENG72_02105 [Thermococcus sp.]|nr:hypothetical protein [Thermococcus sp.]
MPIRNKYLENFSLLKAGRIEVKNAIMMGNATIRGIILLPSSFSKLTLVQGMLWQRQPLG